MRIFFVFENERLVVIFLKNLTSTLSFETVLTLTLLLDRQFARRIIHICSICRILNLYTRKHATVYLYVYEQESL